VFQWKIRILIFLIKNVHFLIKLHDRKSLSETNKKTNYCQNVLDVECQTQGRLKLVIQLYVREKSDINYKFQILYKREDPPSPLYFLFYFFEVPEIFLYKTPDLE
jgi:hypothetical protein